MGIELSDPNYLTIDSTVLPLSPALLTVSNYYKLSDNLIN